MTSVTRSLLAGTMLASFAATAASAADMPAPPPVVIQQPLPVQECCETWYLRGDIGMSQQKVKSIHNIQFDTATNFRFLDSGGFDAAPFFGLGFGYQFNNWFRADFTGEYRGKANFHALDSFSNAGTVNTNEYTASKSEWLFLLNAYADLGTWWHITPFVGAGIGTTRNTIDHYRDNNIIAGGGGWAPSASKWQFAWALHAGLAYKVTNNVTAEFAYRYLNLGDAETGDPLNLNGTNQVLNNPTTFNTITSHDLKFGLRWSFCCEADAYRPQPQPVYAPPPQVYARPACNAQANCHLEALGAHPPPPAMMLLSR
ncbi:MAG: porin family protein [Rhizobiales bacterium]|nr:porin family protein [Hyphomicrobiales bacterium]